MIEIRENRARLLGQAGILKNVWCLTCVLVLGFTMRVTAQDTAQGVPQQAAQGYRIDQPGTITFTVGVKISGKVEKPQVMIFLPKEKSLYREESFDRSFKEELMQPLPFSPIE